MFILSRCTHLSEQTDAMGNGGNRHRFARADRVPEGVLLRLQERLSDSDIRHVLGSYGGEAATLSPVFLFLAWKGRDKDIRAP
jgi:hypothetical protein